MLKYLAVVLLICSVSLVFAQGKKQSEDNRFVPDLIKYTYNSIRNPTEDTIYLFTNGLVGSIEPKSSKTFFLGGDDTLIIASKYKVIYRIKILENKIPIIHLDTLIDLNNTVHLEALQNNYSFKMNVEDEFVSQLDIDIQGPVKAELKEDGYYIKFDKYPGKESFENSSDNDPAKQKGLSFEVIVADKLAGHLVRQTVTAYYYEW